LIVAAETPRNRLSDRPTTRAFAVKFELRGEKVETVEDLPLAVTELERPNDGCQPELALSDERLRIDYEPGLAFGGEDVGPVEILMQKDLLALSGNELLECIFCRLDESLFERATSLHPLVANRPPFGLIAE
jgi:hypothetical protein